VELEAENTIGSFDHVEHDVCIKLLPNDGHLNRVFEIAGIVYGPCLQLGTEASVEALKKRKANPYDKTAGKRAKVEAKRKATPLEVTLSKAKSGSKRSSDMELAFAKPMKKTWSSLLQSLGRRHRSLP
jgi:hypothetical protein